MPTLFIGQHKRTITLGLKEKAFVKQHNQYNLSVELDHQYSP